LTHSKVGCTKEIRPKRNQEKKNVGLELKGEGGKKGGRTFVYLEIYSFAGTTGEGELSVAKGSGRKGEGGTWGITTVVLSNANRKTACRFFEQEKGAFLEKAGQKGKGNQGVSKKESTPV